MHNPYDPARNLAALMAVLAGRSDIAFRILMDIPAPRPERGRTVLRLVASNGRLLDSPSTYVRTNSDPDLTPCA